MFQIEKSLILLTSSFNTTKVFLLITVALADFKKIFSLIIPIPLFTKKKWKMTLYCVISYNTHWTSSHDHSSFHIDACQQNELQYPH